MRILMGLTLVLLACAGTPAHAAAADACKQCRDQQRACMSNYAGPTCKTEYERCIKACRKK